MLNCGERLWKSGYGPVVDPEYNRYIGSTFRIVHLEPYAYFLSGDVAGVDVLGVPGRAGVPRVDQAMTRPCTTYHDPSVHHMP